MKKEFVKHSINFLEHPLWFQDEKDAEKSLQGMVWQDDEGYMFRSGYKIPVKTDAIFLLYLLLKSQETNYSETIVLTQYQMLKECEKGHSKQWYERLRDSLERWKTVGIRFSGNFYDGIDYKEMSFGIIDAWKIQKKTKKLEVRFSPEFLEMMRGRRFFKYVNFTEFKQLASSLASRLYEILSKNFEGRSIWEISAIKLAKKIPLAQIYPSAIIKKVLPAINRVNKHTDLKIEFTVRHKERGKAILIFTKLQTEKPQIIAKQATFDTIPKPELTKVIEALPEGKQKQKSIIEIIQKYYKEFGADYVIRNIKYTKKNAKKNFRQYLNKALKEDWGIILEEDKEERSLQAQLLKVKQRKDIQKVKAHQEEENQKQELEEKVKNYIANLSDQKAEKLREQALETLAPQIIEYLLTAPPKSASGIGARMSLKTRMYKIAQEELNYR